MLEKILEYQKIDLDLIKVEIELNNSEERKQALKMQQYLKESETNLAKMENQAEELLKYYANASKQYDTCVKAFSQYEDVANVKESDFNETAKQIGYVLDDIGRLEKSINMLLEKMQQAQKNYEITKKNVLKARQSFLENRQKYEELRKQKEPDIKAHKEKLEALKTSIEKGLLDRYNKLRQDKKIPPFVPLTKNNQCGGCRMEMPLNFVNQLKTEKVLECENCQRLIYNE
jgi:predicted  nucleic acid-binding Zn-ribbon protein